MEEDLHAVRIEATSEEDSCMVLGLQDIQCPIYYSVESVEPQGYYQTLTRQSGISITRNTFKNGRQYIVLLLKPTDELCFEADKKSTIISKNHQKTVMVRVFPSITDEEFNKAIFGTLGFYVLIYIFSFIICCFFFVRQKKATPEQKKFNIENPNIQNYGTSSGSNSQSLQNFPFPHSSDEAVPLLDAADKQAHVDNSGTVIVDVASSSTSPSPSAFQGSNAQSLQDFPFHHPSVWTFIIHLLGCSSRFHKSGQLLDADKRVFLSDLAINEDKYFSDRTKVYSWNLLTIAIFYGLPVIQLVYINQGFVNVTGNQDLCYYNFLCSHQVGLFSDFNHIYSNIGYVMLGILFLLLVLRRDLLDKSEMGKENVPQSEWTTLLEISDSALYSASVVEKATVRCFRASHVMAPPACMQTNPVNERLSAVQEAKFASPNAGRGSPVFLNSMP
ncbi:hypothetical protein JTE90_010488 [Oedothorax gibbosus]|uniref:SID1 transmembrane family member 1 n=1 Tax=Oedothorax gibbosus TaxID=931172 RepID=A0AAV6W495_9ARAC|nr:hypothetical protein JTE90_010488 [Oedothorax gibbosus]